ncbi:hypothetical protein IWW50_005333, partial [Coemansia erecta]
MHSPIDDAVDEHLSHNRLNEDQSLLSQPNAIDEAEISGILSAHFNTKEPVTADQSKQLSFPDSDATPVPDFKKEGVELTPLSSDDDAIGEKHTVKHTQADDAEEEEDSPYEVVRHSVSNTDDPTMYSLTFRVWVLGVAFTGVL